MQASPHALGRSAGSEARLDENRVLSMADEGGAAGATMDLQEQLGETRRASASRPATAGDEANGLRILATGVLIAGVVSLLAARRAAAAH